MPYQTVTAEIEICAAIEGEAQQCDYGVPRSPVWTEVEPDDWADNYISIVGVNVKLKDLPQELRNALWDAIIERIDDTSWSE